MSSPLDIKAYITFNNYNSVILVKKKWKNKNKNSRNRHVGILI